MPLEFERFAGPFRKVWSLVGRSLVVDAAGRQVVRPSSDVGTRGWHDDKADWERLAPLFADAVPLYEAASRLAGKLEGPGVRRVDGRIVIEESDFADMLDVLDRIRDGMPKPAAAPADDVAAESEAGLRP